MGRHRVMKQGLINETWISPAIAGELLADAVYVVTHSLTAV